MTHSRRQFLKIGSVGVAGAVLVGRADAAAEPVLGMVFPPANYPVPPEARQLYPSGIRFLAEGVGLERMTPAEYDRVFGRIIPATQKLAAAGANAISVMGTSLTFYKGAAFNQQLIDDVKKATGLPATTMSTGIVEGLRTLGARRVAVATAYQDEVNRRLGVFLSESGFEVLGVKGLGIERFEDSPPVTQDGLLQFCASVGQSMSKADALVISCGNLKTLDLVVPLEQRCRMPVVSSTPHALWNGVRLLGLSGQSKGFGTILDRA
jgi:arylmalonate decarboxylase